MITERRVFQAKVGQADAVVKVLKDGQRMMEGMPSRIYTDHMSGQTDRVVWEFDYESLGAMETAMATVTDPSQQAEFGKWFSALASLIEGASVEHWRRQD